MVLLLSRRLLRARRTDLSADCLVAASSLERATIILRAYRLSLIASLSGVAPSSAVDRPVHFVAVSAVREICEFSYQAGTWLSILLLFLLKHMPRERTGKRKGGRKTNVEEVQYVFCTMCK
jgi:hypothetical protein